MTAPTVYAKTTTAFFHLCPGYPDGACHCFHPFGVLVGGRAIPDETSCPNPMYAENLRRLRAMTDQTDYTDDPIPDETEQGEPTPVDPEPNEEDDPTEGHEPTEED